MCLDSELADTHSEHSYSLCERKGLGGKALPQGRPCVSMRAITMGSGQAQAHGLALGRQHARLEAHEPIKEDPPPGGRGRRSHPHPRRY
jgi:hypothetical protein